MNISSKKNVDLMYIPALILFIIFVLYPFLEGIRISFTDWNGYSQKYNYIGFKNYLSFFGDKNIMLAFKNTLIYGLGSTIFQQLLGLGYALLLNNSFKGRTFTRTLVYLPVLIAAIIMGYMWYFIFQYSHGALNDVVLLFKDEGIDLLSNGKIAVWIITLVNTLQYVGISMVIYLAGLQSISKIYYEAAEIDGATKFQQFKNITLPLLKPAIVTSVTLNLIGGLKLFDPIKALTGGGPGYASHSMSTLIDYTYFRNQMAGYASTMGIALFLFIMIVSIIIQIATKKEVD